MSPARALALFAAFSLAGCASSPDAVEAGRDPSCPLDLPDVCPDPVPSYTNDVAPILEKRCVPCHSAAGVAFKKPLDGYDAVFSRRSAVLNQLYSCHMPPPDAGRPDAEERRVIFGWLVCHAPDN